MDENLAMFVIYALVIFVNIWEIRGLQTKIERLENFIDIANWNNHDFE